jgi:hypothetical protein
MRRPHWGRRYGAVALAGCTMAATALVGPAGAQAGVRARAASGTLGPTVELTAAQNSISLPRFGGFVMLDPGVYVASLGSALQFDVGRASYTKPITITQVIHTASGIQTRALPAAVLDGFNGLRNFLHLAVKDSHGKVVASQQVEFCPDSFAPARATPNGPATSPYPQQCAPFDPFPLGNVWGVARGWAVDPFQTFGNGFQLALGTYHVTVTVTSLYRRLLHISAAHATANVTVRVVRGVGCCGPALRRGQVTGRPLASLPRNVPNLAHPPTAALPDLVPLPSWGISTSRRPGRNSRDLLNFSATVWVGGNGPLDVQGFRSHGSPVMQAYQYFWRNGRIVGRARAGTMGFDTANGHDHWHFQQFAQYSLLNSARTLAVASHKVGFCIAATDNVNLLLRHAAWQPSFIGFSGMCGQSTALWVQEYMPVGWGDSYQQSVAGQAFDITSVPNGTYYVQVTANPGKILYETTTSNDVSLRQVILGGTRGHRTVRVPAWHGIDPEGGATTGPGPTPIPSPSP